MVWKPGQQPPLSALAMAGLLATCGPPHGVLDLVTGPSASQAEVDEEARGRVAFYLQFATGCYSLHTPLAV
jgi:acyl-CoA reductase-like NAD-dependent aldehyde dehydrogenase